MLRLGLPRESRWLDLGQGVEILARPLTTALYRAATATAFRKALGIAEERGLIEEAGGSIRDIPASTDRDGIDGIRQQFMLQALAVHAIENWKGVGNVAGSPATITPENVAIFIRDFPIHATRFEEKYLYEISHLVDEGNASGVGPNGTSAAAPDIAADASLPAEVPAPITSMPQQP